MLRSAGNRLKPCAYPYADCGGLVVRGARSYKFQACGQKNQGCGSLSATLGKKSQAFGIYREETGVKKKADWGRYSYCSCGLCCFFFCLPTLMMNSIYIYIIIAPKIFGAMLHCLFRQLSVVHRWHRAKSNDNSHVCCLLISLRLSFRRRYTSLWLGPAMSREAFGR